MGLNTSVDISSDKITIDLSTFIHKDYVFTGKELLLDIFGNYYSGQSVEFLAHDGDSVTVSGLNDFIEYLVAHYSVDKNKVTITHLSLDSIFKASARNIKQNFIKDLTNAKFVGFITGRFSPVRFRLAYELDTAFSGDTYIIFRPNKGDIDWYYRNTEPLYTKELDWFDNKVFDKGSSTPDIRDWQNASNEYPDIWNNFLIEAVAETDCHTNWWFTEKTSRCLATGKPFILLSGQHSLKNLKNKGYLTYSNIMDETYDLEPNPETRIKKIVESLKDIYYSSDKQNKVKELYRIAGINQQIHLEYVNRKI